MLDVVSNAPLASSYVWSRNTLLGLPGIEPLAVRAHGKYRQLPAGDLTAPDNVPRGRVHDSDAVTSSQL
jgi:hypothetical protein